MRRRRLLGSGEFSPKLLFTSGVQGIWLDPSDLSTMFQDTAGTTPVTAVGQQVQLILDKSGNGNNASQSTLASAPYLRQTAGGLYYLEFDGSNDSLSTSSINLTNTDKVMSCSGLRFLTDSAQVVFETSANSDTTNGAFYLTHVGTSKIRHQVRGTSAALYGENSNSVPATNVYSQFFDLANPNASKISVRKNSVSQSLTLAGSTSGGSGIAFGNHSLFIGRRNNASFPFNGHIFSLIIAGKNASDSEITKAETWVNQKTAAY